MLAIINKISTNILIRILIFELSLIGSISILLNNVDVKEFDKTDVLELIISASSIITAIIITYFFSKLFAEKTDRIQRKAEIDILSQQVSAFRKIAFHIRGSDEFWNTKKSTIDSKYSNLTYEEFRGEQGNLTYEQITKIIADIGETSGQAYLALKGLENKQQVIGFLVSFNPQNYTLDEIRRFREYSISFWAFLDKSDASVNFNTFNEHYLKYIDELFLKITSREINKHDYKNEIKNLYAHFESEVFQKHYYLTNLNSTLFSKHFLSITSNLSIFILIIITSLLSYISKFNCINEITIVILITSIFISNTIDLMVILANSLKSELIIEDFYKI